MQVDLDGSTDFQSESFLKETLVTQHALNYIQNMFPPPDILKLEKKYCRCHHWTVSVVVLLNREWKLNRDTAYWCTCESQQNINRTWKINQGKAVLQHILIMTDHTEVKCLVIGGSIKRAAFLTKYHESLEKLSSFIHGRFKQSLCCHCCCLAHAPQCYVTYSGQHLGPAFRHHAPDGLTYVITWLSQPVTHVCY